MFVAVTGWLAFGHFAVSTFIVISGFCLMLPVVRRDGMLAGGFIEFMKRRGRRILPPYYLTLAISIALAATLIGAKTQTIWDSSIPISLAGLYSHVVMLQDFAIPSQINYPLWSISVEWRIYLLFPLLVLLWRRAGPLRTTAAACAASYAVYVLFERIGLVLPGSFNSIVPQYIALFTLGMLGATMAFSPDARWRRLRDRIPWTLVAACAFAAFAYVQASYTLPDHGCMDALLGIGVIGMLMAASHSSRNPIHAVLSWKPLVFIGTMSYSLYLLHAPLLQLVWQYGLRPLRLSDDVTFICLIFAGTPLIIAGTYIFHLIGERPFMTTSHRRAAEAGREKQQEDIDLRCLLPTPTSEPRVQNELPDDIRREREGIVECDPAPATLSQ